MEGIERVPGAGPAGRAPGRPVDSGPHAHLCRRLGGRCSTSRKPSPISTGSRPSPSSSTPASFRFTLHHVTAEWLAARLQLREAVAELESAMSLADRASPSVGISALCNLAWWAQLLGEQQIAGSGRPTRSLGATRLGGHVRPRFRGAAPARARRATRQRGTGRWCVMHPITSALMWPLGDVIGDANVTILHEDATPNGSDAPSLRTVVDGGPVGLPRRTASATPSPSWRRSSAAAARIGTSGCSCWPGARPMRAATSKPLVCWGR